MAIVFTVRKKLSLTNFSTGWTTKKLKSFTFHANKLELGNQCESWSKRKKERKHSTHTKTILKWTFLVSIQSPFVISVDLFVANCSPPVSRTQKCVCVYPKNERPKMTLIKDTTLLIFKRLSIWTHQLSPLPKQSMLYLLPLVWFKIVCVAECLIFYQQPQFDFMVSRGFSSSRNKISAHD